MSTTVATPQQQELRKKKSQFYTEVFSYREPNLSPKERIYKDSMVTAEVKTNVIVRVRLWSCGTADQALPFRSKMNTNSCKTFLSTCPIDTNDPPHPSS